MCGNLCVRITLIAVLIAQPLPCLDVRGAGDDYVVVEYGAQVLSRISVDGDRILLHRFRERTWPRSVVVDSGGTS